MRPTLKYSLVWALVAGALFSFERSLMAQDAAADPAALARADVAQKLADDAIARRKSAEGVVAEAQGKVKVAAQAFAKSKADESKATADVAAAEKALTEKTAAANKATEDAKA